MIITTSRAVPVVPTTIVAPSVAVMAPGCGPVDSLPTDDLLPVQRLSDRDLSGWRPPLGRR